MRRALTLAIASGSRRPSVAARALATPHLVAARSLQSRFFSSRPTGKDDDFVEVHHSGHVQKSASADTAAAVMREEASTDELEDEDDDDVEDMVAIGPSGVEYGGPTRGGKLKEPTRYGDWERKGRCSDF
ncbi:hypothetical protein BBJ28_00014480 [Nothophytophthora sp. Chile5]|nr:hypothetical protein BBJ28_00014480 [Nothophytophthora sp. Chile5]